MNTLEKYRQDLERLLFPAFTYLYLEMIKHSLLSDANTFFKEFSIDHPFTDEISVLATLNSVTKLESDAARTFLDNRVKVKISKYALQLLMSFIESEGFSLMFWIVNKYLEFEVTQESVGTRAVLLDDESKQVRNNEHLTLTGYSEDARSKREVRHYLPRPPLHTEKRREEDEQENVRMNVSDEQPPSICFHTILHAQESLICADVSEEGSMLVCGFDDSYIRLWDLKTQTVSVKPNLFEEAEEAEYRTFLGHSGPVFSLKFSPCNRLFASASEDGTVRLWSLISMTNVSVLKGHLFAVWCLAFSLQGYYLVSGGADQTARVWVTDAVTAVRVCAGHLGDVTAVKFHPSGTYLGTGSSDKTVRLWDLQTGQCCRLFSGHCVSVTSLDFSYSGKVLFSADDAGAVVAWDIGESGVIWESQIKGAVTALSTSHEDTLLSVASEENRVCLLNVRSGTVTLDCPTKNTPVFACVFTWRDLLIAVGPYRDN